jgi:DNA-binding protein HU-beta
MPAKKKATTTTPSVQPETKATKKTVSKKKAVAEKKSVVEKKPAVIKTEEPQRPKDIEQRNGRGVRSANKDIAKETVSEKKASATKKPIAEKKATAKKNPAEKKVAEKASAPKSKKLTAKNMPKTKSQIIEYLAESSGITKIQSKTMYESLLELAYTGANGPDGITLPGLGKLIKVKRKARIGRNPKTGESIKIKASTALKFRLAKPAKDAILGSN